MDYPSGNTQDEPVRRGLPTASLSWQTRPFKSGCFSPDTMRSFDRKMFFL